MLAALYHHCRNVTEICRPGLKQCSWHNWVSRKRHDSNMQSGRPTLTERSGNATYAYVGGCMRKNAFIMSDLNLCLIATRHNVIWMA